ncbi:MAG TPA: hypothetical protein VIU44_05840, partial [Gaiellaceae bacterium]
MRTIRALLLTALCALAVPAAASAAGHATPLKLVAHDTSKPLRTMGATAHPGKAAPALRSARPSVFPTLRLDRPRAGAKGVHTRRTGLGMPASDANFDGLAQTSSTPPDPNGDVGPTQYVQAVNGRLGVFSKTGVLLARADNTFFWAHIPGAPAGDDCSLHPRGDPVVVYDSIDDRWVYTEFAFANGTTGPFVQCIAVSTTGDATGSWYRYVYELGDQPGGDPQKLLDYPKLGVWSDGFYLSANQYVGGSFAGPAAVAFESAKMLLGQNAQALYMDLWPVVPRPSFGMLPADLDGSALPPAGGDYFLESQDDPADVSDQLRVWKFDVNWAAPASGSFGLVPNGTLPVAAFDSNMCNGAESCIPQPGTSTGLDALAGGRLMFRLQYRNFGSSQTLTVNQTVDVGADHAGIRWYVLRKGAGDWAVDDSGTYAPDGESRFMGSAALDAAGNLAVAFSVSGAATNPSLRYAGRLAGDPAGQLSQGEATLIAGPQASADSRWGDYSDLTVDPGDDCTFWYTGEYYGGSGWSTRIGSFRFPGCTQATTPRYTATPSISGSAVSGTTLTALAGTWANAVAPFTYQWLRCNAHGFECSAILGATATTYAVQAGDEGSTLRVRERATNGAGSRDSLSAATLMITAPLPAVPTSTVAPAVSGSGVLGGPLTVTTGTWASAVAIAEYHYVWHRCNAAGAACTVVGTDASGYTPVGIADVGGYFKVDVTAVNTGGTSAPATSNLLGPLGNTTPPVNTVLPTTTGVPAVGTTLGSTL